MGIYKVYYREGLFSDTQLFLADTMEQALKKARKYSKEAYGDAFKTIESIQFIGISKE